MELAKTILVGIAAQALHSAAVENYDENDGCHGSFLLIGGYYYATNIHGWSGWVAFFIDANGEIHEFYELSKDVVVSFAYGFDLDRGTIHNNLK